ncbi:MAG: T9SS type A sorting domain-containing protein [Bacteroidetes bacterium]|nr:T9SS type A sorting domain-containing protein [Bacteroidota bacterium]
MKKNLSVIALLLICNFISFGQDLTVKPSFVSIANTQEKQGFDQDFKQKMVSKTKAVIWSSNMLNASQWVAAKLADQSSTITNQWEWIADTSAFSYYWKYYVGSLMGSATPMQGVFYFDGITNILNANYGVTNTTLTNAIAISTIGHPTVNIKFYQLYKSFNVDTTILEVSTDNINWNSIIVNPKIPGMVNTYTYGWKEYSLTQWIGNKSQVWIRFRFSSPGTTTSGAQYSGGYGWAIDDVELFDPANNNIQINRTTLYNGYSKIPSGLGMPMTYDADLENLGGLSQTNVKLHGVELTTAKDSSSLGITLNTGQSITNVSVASNFFIPPSVLGTYKVMSYISSDSIPFLLAQDTFDVNVVCNTCMYSRDYDNYTGSRWAGTTGTLADPYTACSIFQVGSDRMAYGVNFVVNKESKPGSRVRAVLYKFDSGTFARYIVAQSNNYYITAADIPTTVPIQHPPSISLAFTSGYTMQKDSMYYIGVMVYGGTDTVKIATDNSAIPQNSQSSQFFNTTANAWYIWTTGNVPPLMIRTIFSSSTTLPSNAGAITGLTSVCQGQSLVNYSVPAIANATSYEWTLPSGVTGSSSTNTITVNYSNTAVSGNIYVRGANAFGNGVNSALAINVNSLPPNALIISGATSVLSGQQNVVYSVPVNANVTSYIWTLPTGCTGTSNTNQITVNFGSTAFSGNIIVKGINACGTGPINSLYVTVNPLVPNCSAQFNMVADTIPHVYSIVNNASGIPPLHFYWSWGDGTHDTTALPVHTYSTGGYYNICLKVTDSVGCISTYCDSTFLQKGTNNMISVKVYPGAFLGIDNNSSTEKIKIYPNPATYKLTLDLQQLKDLHNTIIYIYDIQGQLILQQTINDKETELNISSFAKGVYVIKVNNDKQRIVSKFVKE